MRNQWPAAIRPGHRELPSPPWLYGTSKNMEAQPSCAPQPAGECRDTIGIGGLAAPPLPHRVRIRRFAGLSGNSCSIDAVVWMSANVAPASTPLISASQGFTPSRRSEAGCPEFSRMADAISLHLLVTSSVQAFSETRSAYYALC
jgi:hypothetical protein